MKIFRAVGSMTAVGTTTGAEAAPFTAESNQMLMAAAHTANPLKPSEMTAILLVSSI